MDFSRISNFIGELLGGATNNQSTASSIGESLQQAGIDPTLLVGLNQAQIVEILQQHGIDGGLLENIDISSLADATGRGEGSTPIAEFLGRVVQR